MSPARPQRDLSGALSLTIEGITLIGNIFPILVVTWIKKSSKKTVTDILICALALTDIFAVLAPLPVSLPTFICQDHWKKGPAACHYYQFCVFWLQNVASLLVIAMSVERVMALAMPLRYKSWSTRNRVYMTIGGIYAATFMISCLPLFGLVPPVMSKRGSPFCRSWVSAASDKWYQSVFPMVLIVEFWTNMLIVLILNSFLVYYLIRFGRRLQPASVKTDKKGVIRRRLSSAVVADKIGAWRQKHNIAVEGDKNGCLRKPPTCGTSKTDASRLKHLSTATDDNGVWRLKPLSAATDKYGTWRLKSLSATSDKGSIGTWSNRSSVEKDKKGTKKHNSLHIDRRDFNEFSKLVIVVAVLFYCTWLPVLVSILLNCFINNLLSCYKYNYFVKSNDF